ncbi:hypothetical protein l13_07330 [Neisseria weaveri ATCC 51223]|nr:hypothetical protein l13_07330 [Neisseria weaveri ATCC 51223]
MSGAMVDGTGYNINISRCLCPIAGRGMMLAKFGEFAFRRP